MASTTGDATVADPPQTEEAYKEMLARDAGGNESILQTQENALMSLANLYKQTAQPQALAQLIRSSFPLLSQLSKAKTAKLIRNLIDMFSEIPDRENDLGGGEIRELQIEVCRESIEWAVREKRAFLKQGLETRLVALYLDAKLYTESLNLIQSLLKELKRLDDKMVLVEVQLLESRVCHALRNIPRSRAALTSARTSANSIYTPPLLQAQLDMQSGILHAEEKDYKTAYSYFYEAFEGFSGVDDPRAVGGLKYMLLCKIMLGATEDIQSLTSSKLALKHAGPEIDSLRAISAAHTNRSLSEFEKALKTYPKQLNGDPIIRVQLASLYDTLLEQNLVRVIEPFSRVEISHVAEVVGLPETQVEAKLSQMILDKAFSGILDQGAGCLIVFDEPQEDKTYEAAIETLKQMEKVVESLYEKAWAAKLT